MGKPTITLYVDTVSPFAYEAYHILRHDAVFRDCEVTYVPIFLGGLMKACNNRPPIEIKNKDKWIDKQRLLWAKMFSIPMRADIPPGFPVKTLSVMRTLAHIDQADRAASLPQTRLIRALDAIYHAFFAEHRPQQEAETLAKILAGLFGKDEAEEVMRLGASAEAKEALSRNTDLAFKDGAFGLPWIVCTNAEGERDTFWGVDNIGLAATFLGLEKPQSKTWRALL